MTEATIATDEAAVRSTLLKELTSALKQFKLPDVDVAGIVESRRKDIDALADANATALRGAQNLGQVQAELLKGTLDQVHALLRRVRRSSDDATPAARDVVVQGVQHALSDMRELAEIGYRTQAETFAVISRRAQEDLQEFTARLQPEAR